MSPWCVHSVLLQRKATKRKRRAPRLEPFTDEELAAAKAEIQSEAVGIQVMHEVRVPPGQPGAGT